MAVLTARPPGWKLLRPSRNPRRWLGAIGTLLSGLALSVRSAPIELRDQRELFVDDYLIARTSGVDFRLGTPVPAGTALTFDQPWEGRYSGAYITLFQDGEIFRMYYRGSTTGNNDVGDDEWKAQVTCYAESRDGIHWRKPNLRLHEVNGTLDNNVILPPSNPYVASDNFSVLYDDRPGVPADERFKAIGGQTREEALKVTKLRGGLYRYVSSDGIHWKLHSPVPLFEKNTLGSLNVLSWIPAENSYAIYLRSWTGSGGVKTEGMENVGFRTIARSVSKDFVTWSEPRNMSFGSTPSEHLYTNATKPYFRAPQILIAMPMRFLPQRVVLSEEQFRQADVHSLSWKGVSDAVLMTSRGGFTYDRKFMQSFIRPGMDDGSWAARSTLPALGHLQTGPAELSVYVMRGYGTHANRLERLTLRLDGFASLHADYNEGNALTKPLILRGGSLLANYSTSAAGYIRIAILDEDEQEIPGFGEADAEENAGNRIDFPVTWKSGKTLTDLSGRTVRMKFTLRDADLYSVAVKN